MKKINIDNAEAVYKEVMSNGQGKYVIGEYWIYFDFGNGMAKIYVQSMTKNYQANTSRSRYFCAIPFVK
jgi:hypothetical protein